MTQIGLMVRLHPFILCQPRLLRGSRLENVVEKQIASLTTPHRVCPPKGSELDALRFERLFSAWMRSLLNAPVLSPHVGEWITEWASAWSVTDLASMVRVGFSDRLTRALGRCTPETGSIRLNRKLIKANHEILREVLCHEVAHVAVWRSIWAKRPAARSGVAATDGVGRLRASRQMGTDAGLTIRSPPTGEFTSYEHVCPVCGSSWTAKRPVSSWRCRACLDAGLEGRLEVHSRPTGRNAQR